MTSLDRPVWAPLLDFRQNQARFRGFPCASADNADSRPTAAAGDRSRCSPPGAEGRLGRPALLATAGIRCSPRWPGPPPRQTTHVAAASRGPEDKARPRARGTRHSPAPSPRGARSPYKAVPPPRRQTDGQARARRRYLWKQGTSSGPRWGHGHLWLSFGRASAL